MQHLQPWHHTADTTAMHPLLSRVCCSASASTLSCFLHWSASEPSQISLSTKGPCPPSKWLCAASFNTLVSGDHLPPAYGPSGSWTQLNLSYGLLCAFDAVHFSSPWQTPLPAFCPTPRHNSKSLVVEKSDSGFSDFTQQCVICSCCCILALSTVGFAYSCFSPLVTIDSVSDENITLMSFSLSYFYASC